MQYKRWAARHGQALDEVDEMGIHTDVADSEADNRKVNSWLMRMRRKRMTATWFNGVVIGLKNTKSQRKYKGWAREYSVNQFFILRLGLSV